MTKQTETTANSEFPYIDTELVPFVLPLRAKIEEHGAALERFGILAGMGPELEWRSGHTLIGAAGGNALWAGLEGKTRHARYLPGNRGYNIDPSADENGDILETRGIAEGAIASCENVYLMYRDMQELAHHKPFVVANHYHWHFMRGRDSLIEPPPLSALPPEGRAMLIGIMAMAEMNLAFSVPISYMHNPDGLTKGFDYSEGKGASHRYKSNGGVKCVEERANLKGDQSLVELSVCRTLGGARWGLEHFHGLVKDQASRDLFAASEALFMKGERIQFVPKGVRWDEHYQQKLEAARQNPVVAQCFGEDTHRMLDYFARQLEMYRKDLSLGKIAAVAANLDSRHVGF